VVPDADALGCAEDERVTEDIPAVVNTRSSSVRISCYGIEQRCLARSRVEALHGQYRRSDRQVAASLESPLIYNELHERIAFAIRSIIHWNCSDRNLRRGSDRDARAQGDLRE
jgi:hypothetical protein